MPQGARLGRWAGVWLTTGEIVNGMVHVTGEGEQPVTEVYEGAIVRDAKMRAAVVFEVLLRDGERWFLIPV